jgi:hypothetical protein
MMTRAHETSIDIPFGVFDQTGVLFRKEKFLCSNLAITAQKFGRFALQFDQLFDDFLFAWFGCTDRRGITVFLWLVAKMIEAGVARSRAFRRIGIDLFQVFEHRLNRGV